MVSASESDFFPHSINLNGKSASRKRSGLVTSLTWIQRQKAKTQINHIKTGLICIKTTATSNATLRKPCGKVWILETVSKLFFHAEVFCMKKQAFEHILGLCLHRVFVTQNNCHICP